MHVAFRTLDYDGVFTYYTLSRAQRLEFSQSRAIDAAAPEGNGASFARRETRTLGFGMGYRTIARVATFRVVHKVVDGIERERIVQLDGPPREILRTGDDISYVLPSGDELLALQGTAPARPYDRVFGRRFEDMGDSYQVLVEGRYREAARPAVLLSVTPRHRDRFAYRLWLDEETGLLLRSELKDSQGTDLEIFKFTSLRLGDAVADVDLRPAAEGAVVSRPPEPATVPPATSNWRARWVPPGFRLNSAAVRQQPGDAQGVDTLVFSDGLAAFSVFIEAMPPTGAGTVVSRNGGTVVLTHSTAGDAGSHLVTVVGEVPVATARRVAAGVFQEPL